MKIISLFDYTGNWSKPYRDNGYDVIQIDIKHGCDILTWDYSKFVIANACNLDIYAILAAIPSTDYALAGARWFREKDRDGRTEQSNKLVRKVFEIIMAVKPKIVAIENPISRIHTLNPWMGKPHLKFNPCDYAGYDPVPENSQYLKMTWLWGNFNLPAKKYRPPLVAYYPGWKNLGGKSERTKTIRSTTPLGFAWAFYEANHA